MYICALYIQRIRLFSNTPFPKNQFSLPWGSTSHTENVCMKSNNIWWIFASFNSRNIPSTKFSRGRFIKKVQNQLYVKYVFWNLMSLLQTQTFRSFTSCFYLEAPLSYWTFFSWQFKDMKNISHRLRLSLLRFLPPFSLS